MAATLRKLDGEPILIVTHHGFVDLKAAEEATAQIAEVLAQSPEPIYGIIDMRSATTDMGALARILVHQSRNAPGTIGSNLGRVVFVGSHPLVRIFRRMMQRETPGGDLIPIYSTLDDALASQRDRIRKASEQ